MVYNLKSDYKKKICSISEKILFEDSDQLLTRPMLIELATTDSLFRIINNYLKILIYISKL